MLSLSKFGIHSIRYKFIAKVDFLKNIIYTNGDIGGVIVNEFEKDIQSKNNDVVDSIKGFAFSFIFFLVLFAIGVIISVAGA